MRAYRACGRGILPQGSRGAVRDEARRGLCRARGTCERVPSEPRAAASGGRRAIVSGRRRAALSRLYRVWGFPVVARDKFVRAARGVGSNQPMARANAGPVRRGGTEGARRLETQTPAYADPTPW